VKTEKNMQKNLRHHSCDSDEKSCCIETNTIYKLLKNSIMYSLSEFIINLAGNGAGCSNELLSIIRDGGMY
jgi:hypothetical protein